MLDKDLAHLATLAEAEAANNFKLKPHPDGKPWIKCCAGPELSGREGSCQCLMRKAADGKSRYENSLNADGMSNFYSLNRLRTEMGRFFCVHRSTDDGFHRECAGWAAKITGNKP